MSDSKSRISICQFGVVDQHQIDLIRIHNNKGAFVDLINYGAGIKAIVIPNKDALPINRILGFDTLEEYINDTSYVGSTIGPYANRIANAEFSINSNKYKLFANDGVNCNHGGFDGFNTKIFDYKCDNDRVCFTYFRKDGEGGFPGNLKFDVTYSFNHNNRLTIKYYAQTDRSSILSPTNHAYFNLSGGLISGIDHSLTLFSDSYLEFDKNFLPTGTIQKVDNTPFDFRQKKIIAQAIKQLPSQSRALKGFNEYFIKSEASSKLLASIEDPITQMRLDIYSSFPGCQFYTGDYLHSPSKEKRGFQAFDGICLEPHYFPNLRPCSTASSILTPQSHFRELIEYQFVDI